MNTKEMENEIDRLVGEQKMKNYIERVNKKYFISGASFNLSLNAEGYESLASVLERAFDQAARGKGKERHSTGEPFTDQVIIEGARRFGTGALLFQAFKKSEESQRLPTDRAVAELLGAIVYLASAVIVLEESKA